MSKYSTLAQYVMVNMGVYQKHNEILNHLIKTRAHLTIDWGCKAISIISNIFVVDFAIFNAFREDAGASVSHYL